MTCEGHIDPGSASVLDGPRNGIPEPLGWSGKRTWFRVEPWKIFLVIPDVGNVIRRIGASHTEYSGISQSCLEPPLDTVVKWTTKLHCLPMYRATQGHTTKGTDIVPGWVFFPQYLLGW